MITKQEKNELNIASLRNMLNCKNENDTDKVETIALSVYNLANAMKILIEKPCDEEVKEVVSMAIDNVSKSIHRVITKDGSQCE